jgi:tetratricopeptide (TPR) repeat protein
MKTSKTILLKDSLRCIMMDGRDLSFMKRLSVFARSKLGPTSCVALLMSFSPGVRADGRCGVPPAFSPKTKPGSAAAYQELGNWSERNGQPGCAVDAFHQEVLRNPESASSHISLGSALEAAGRSEDAARELRRAIELEPSSQVAHLDLGVLEHDRGNQAEALVQWEEVVRLDPGSVRALDWIAKTRIEAHQYTAAVDLLSTAPDTEDLAIDRVVAYSQAAFYEQAIAAGERSVEGHADWLRLRMAVATVLAQRNRYQEAISLLQKGLKAHPDEIDLQVLYLRILVLMGDLTKSETYATDFLKQHPDNFDGLYLNGLLNREDGAYPAALAHLQAAEALKPNHFDVHFNLGATLAKLHRIEEARTELERAATLDDSGPEVHFQLAGVLRSLNDAAGAKQQMELYQEKLRSRALRDQTVSLAAQAGQRLEAGDAAGAVEAESEILKILPDDAVHYYDLSLAQDRLEDFAAEQSALEHAVALRPDFAQAYNQLGYLAIRKGDSQAAEVYFHKAIASAPQYAEAESNLGSLLAKEGKDAEAEQYFRSAVAANPRYTEAWINLGASLAARSMFTDAREAVENALRVEPHNADAVQLLALLPPQEKVKVR